LSSYTSLRFPKRAQGYRQCVTFFTEELPWLRGRGLCEWIGWDLKFDYLPRPKEGCRAIQCLYREPPWDERLLLDLTWTRSGRQAM